MVTMEDYFFVPMVFKNPKFKVGDEVYKPKGYQFPSTIVSVFQNKKGETRVVAELDGLGVLNIFREEELELKQKAKLFDKESYEQTR